MENLNNSADAFIAFSNSSHTIINVIDVFYCATHVSLATKGLASAIPFVDHDAFDSMLVVVIPFDKISLFQAALD